MLVNVNGETRPFRCMELWCPACGILAARALTARIVGACEAGGLSFLNVLTLPDRTEPPARAVRRLARMRTLLLDRMRRAGYLGPYVAVLEPHEDGFPHLNVATGCPVEPAWLQAVWSDLGGGMAYAAPPDAGRAPRVLGFYLSKSFPTSAGRPDPWLLRVCLEGKGQAAEPLRRWTCSRDVGRAPCPRISSWRVAIPVAVPGTGETIYAPWHGGWAPVRVEGCLRHAFDEGGPPCCHGPSCACAVAFITAPNWERVIGGLPPGQESEWTLDARTELRAGRFYESLRRPLTRYERDPGSFLRAEDPDGVKTPEPHPSFARQEGEPWRVVGKHDPDERAPPASQPIGGQGRSERVSLRDSVSDTEGSR